MAYPIWQATITDDNGNVLPGAEITVVNETTGLNATLYSTRNGTAKSNPFFATVDGFAQFYAAPGLYRITATDGGTGTAQTFRYVRLVEVATSAEALAGTAGVLPDAAGVHAAFKQFGLGANSAKNVGTDFTILDSPLTPNGFYEVTSSGWTSAPPGTSQYRLIHIRHSNNGGYATQIAFGFSSGVAFIRTAFNSLTFGSWVELFHTGNTVGTVSQSGGVPTGAIIQRGSNANGEFVRFADGTQICTLVKAISGVWNVGAELDRTWTFPIAFVSNPIVPPVVYGGDSAGNGIAQLEKVISTTLVTVRVKNNTLVDIGTSGANVEKLTAIGRWY